MKPALRVVTPGLLTTVQDLGRHGYQHLGIPVCGALDPVSLQAANALVGVHRTLINYVRVRVLADDVPVRLATDVREQGIRAFALLEHGLGDYAVKSP